MATNEMSQWLNEDGTAKDPAQYREMLRSDPERWAKIEENPETAAIIMGDDVNAFQELLKSAMEVWAVPRVPAIQFVSSRFQQPLRLLAMGAPSIQNSCILHVLEIDHLAGSCLAAQSVAVCMNEKSQV